MAMAIMILSNETGKDTATIVAASQEDAKEVAGIAKRATGAKYVGAETMAGGMLVSETMAALGKRWEDIFTGKAV